jgi:hypothetical protein
LFFIFTFYNCNCILLFSNISFRKIYLLYFW